jgi:hypothetical protein
LLELLSFQFSNKTDLKNESKIPLGDTRRFARNCSDTLPDCYVEAFEEIDADEPNELIVTVVSEMEIQSLGFLS